MYCFKCGQYNHDSSRFCESCGTNLIQIHDRTNNYPSPPNSIKVNELRNLFSKNKPDIPGIIIAIVMLISSFMPLISSKHSIQYAILKTNVKISDTDYGIYIIIVAIIAIILAAFNRATGVAVCGLAGCGIALLINAYLEKWINNRLYTWINNRPYTDYRHVEANDIAGEGFWILIVCSVALMLWGIRNKLLLKKKQIRIVRGISQFANYNNDDEK